MVNVKDLVKQIAIEKGLNREGIKNSLEIYENVIDAIVNTLGENEVVSITKFGKFSVKEVEEREVRNPKTGEKKIAPAHRAPKFAFSSIVKEAVH